ncbi:hypothetical protein MPSEU_000760200 [Mayamaea pseudoterrestris]|nr:hypothetical protein MPSEU_000760200 [Mayamaea pseudoterrestris]
MQQSTLQNGSVSRIYPFEQEVNEYEDETRLNRVNNAAHESALSSSSTDSPTISTNNDEHGTPSNETLLGTAFLSFMSFALLEIVFALIAGSHAMMGDGAAMTVDAMTYLLNYYAERRKKKLLNINVNGEQVEAMARECTLQQQRTKRKQVLQLEIISPLLSVSALMVITVYVMGQAIHTLLLDLHRSRSEQLSPNVDLMMAFSFLNLVLDCLNVYCFAKAKHLLGYATVEQQEWEGVNGDDNVIQVNKLSSAARSMEGRRKYSLVCADDDYNAHENGCSINGLKAADKSPEMRHQNYHDSHEDDQHANLNMCSAYTHVFADTLRSIAVLIAAAVAKIVPGVSSEEADATAAVFVSILIVFSLVPLFQGLCMSCSEVMAIKRLERQEAANCSPG